MGRTLTRRQASRLIGLTALAFGLPAGVRAQDRADVVIVGAGLSGLHAAMLLEGEGMRVRVVDALPRVGGRCLTLDHLPDRPEAGGLQVGSMYARVHAAVQDLGLAMRPLSGQGPPPGFYLNIGGADVALGDWSASPANRLAEHERAIPPFALARRYLGADRSLADLESWLDPAIQQRLDIPYDRYLADQGASAEAVRLIGVTNYADPIGSMSALNELRKARILRFEAEGGPSTGIAGGTSRLLDAMAANLSSEVLLDHPVVAVEQDRDGVAVVCANGTALRGARAILTAPCSALRDIAFEPALHGPVGQAVASLPYAQATLVFLEIREPFWEVDGLPAMIWSDGPLERVFVVAGQADAPRYVWCFVNGVPGSRLARLSQAEVMAFAMTELARLRPSTKGRVAPAAAVSWSANPYAGGTYAYFAPGQIRAFADRMAQPQGRLHFCGEHTARLQTGMEGAMESGERAALEVLEAA